MIDEYLFIYILGMFSSKYLKCPYYGIWNVHIVVLGVSNNRLTCIQDKKTLSFSYNIHLFFTLFAQRLPNDSLNDSFDQTPPLHGTNLRWLVDFI